MKMNRLSERNMQSIISTVQFSNSQIISNARIHELLEAFVQMQMQMQMRPDATLSFGQPELRSPPGSSSSRVNGGAIVPKDIALMTYRERKHRQSSIPTPVAGRTPPPGLLLLGHHLVEDEVGFRPHLVTGNEQQRVDTL